MLNGKIITAFGKQPLRDLLILHKHNTINNFLKQGVCKARLVPLQNKHIKDRQSGILRVKFFGSGDWLSPIARDTCVYLGIH